MRKAGSVAVVVERVVQSRPVVPERHRTRPPTEAAGVFRLDAVVVEHFEDGVALVVGQPEDLPGELPVDEDAVAPVLRMGPYDRVERREQFLLPHTVPFVPAPLGHIGREPRVVMDGDQLVAHGAHRVGQAVVGVLQARPHGVAADLGRLEHVEDRAHGRGLQEGDVGVPPTGPVHLAVDGQNLCALIDRRQHRVGFGHGAELAGKFGLLLRRQGLVPEEDDVVGVPRVRIAATTPGARGADRSTPEISAPIFGEIGWTPTDVATVTSQILPQFVSPLYVGPHLHWPASGADEGKGPSMSTDDAGPLLAPPVRNYSPWYQWMARLAATEHEDPLPEGDPDPAAIPAWVERVRARLQELMGPEPSAVPLNVETLESIACDGYRRDKVVFDTEDTMSVPAYLLVPDARDGAPPGAAVLACHGHGPGKGQVVGLEHTDMPNADYALQLARRGYIVLAPDLRCFGERLDWNPEDRSRATPIWCTLPWRGGTP